MAEHLSYSVAKRNKKVIEFDIEGVEYHFKPPKKASMMLPVIEQEDVDDMGVMALKVQYDWVEKGLPEEEGKRLKARLADEDDDFDTDDLDEITRWLMKQVEGRPTG